MDACRAGRTHWEHFSARERILILTASILLIGTLLWLGFGRDLARRPVHSIDALSGVGTQEMLRLIETGQKLLVLRSQYKAYAPLGAPSLGVFLEEQLKKNDLYSPDVKMVLEQEDQVLLDFKAVSFDRLMDWSQQLNQRYGVVVRSAHVVKTQKPGIVVASLKVRLHGMATTKTTPPSPARR